MIHQLVESPLAAMTIVSCILHDVLSLSTLFHNVSSVKRGLETFIHIQLSKGPTTAFQSGWGLDFDWTIATPWFFPSSDILLQICSCAWAHFPVDDPVSAQSRPEEFTVDSMTARCPGPVAAEQAQTICSSPPCLTGLRSLVCAKPAKNLHFGLFCPKDIVPEVLWFVQMQLSKPKMFFLERRGFLLQPFQTSHTWGLSSLRCSPLWCFTVSLSIAQSSVNLLEHPLLGRWTTILNVFHLRIIFLSAEWWTTNCSEMAL